MDIHRSTERYEAWLRSRLPMVVGADFEYKHQQMAAGVFPFLRATFYRWAERWPRRCAPLAAAPAVLGVGDLHVENFGTWRDREGRLVWGVNDFDEATRLPYPADLVRLATSAALATSDAHLTVRAANAADAILAGYQESLAQGGRPFVLAERHRELRRLATGDLRDPVRFWAKIQALPAAAADRYPAEAVAALRAALPEGAAGASGPMDIRSRRAGLGSLGRPRLVALADWRGAAVAREVKALLPSAWDWVAGGDAEAVHYGEVVGRAVRCPDPCTEARGRWLVRRLAPDCVRFELAELPAERDEVLLLRAMGREVANIHLGTPSAVPAILADLAGRPSEWLGAAAEQMAADTKADWDKWRQG